MSDTLTRQWQAMMLKLLWHILDRSGYDMLDHETKWKLQVRKEELVVHLTSSHSNY